MADREDSERLRSDSNSDFVTVSRTPECLLRVHSPRTVQSLQGTFTTYCLSFQTTSPVFHLKKSRVRRRFSEFVWLRKKLAKMNNWGNPPPLPAKRFWNVLDPELIESRQEQLQKWIYTVLSEAEYLSCSALHLFLQTELSTAEIQDYLDGSLSEDNIRDLWNNHGRRYNYQPHNPLHNFVDQDPVEILFTEDDITTPDEANLAPTMAPPHPPCPPHPAATTTPTTPTTTATPAPHPEADNTMDSSQKTGGRFQEHSLESSHDHLHVSWARQNSGSDVEEAQRGHRDWGHLSPAPGSNASELNLDNDDHSPASEAQKEPRQQQQQQQQQQSVQTQQRDPQAVLARSRAELGSADEESLESLPEGKARLWREPQQTDELCNKEPGLQHSAGNSEPATEPPLRSQPSDAEPELRRDGRLQHGQQQDQEQQDHDDQHKQAQQEQAQAQQEQAQAQQEQAQQEQEQAQQEQEQTQQEQEEQEQEQAQQQQEQVQQQQVQQEQEQEQQEQREHEQQEQEQIQQQQEQAQQQQAQQQQKQQQQEQAQQQQEQQQQEQAQQQQAQQEQEQAQQQQEQQEQEQAQQKQEQAQQKQEQEQIQQQREQAQQQQEQAEQKQEQAQQKQEQEQIQQQRVQAQQKQEQTQQEQEQSQQQREQDQQKHEQQDQKQTQHEKTQQQISPMQPSSETAGSQEDRHAATTAAELLTAGKAADAGGEGGMETGMDYPDPQSSPPAVGLALSINGD